MEIFSNPRNNILGLILLHYNINFIFYSYIYTHIFCPVGHQFSASPSHSSLPSDIRLSPLPHSSLHCHITFPSSPHSSYPPPRFSCPLLLIFTPANLLSKYAILFALPLHISSTQYLFPHAQHFRFSMGLTYPQKHLILFPFPIVFLLALQFVKLYFLGFTLANTFIKLFTPVSHC